MVLARCTCVLDTSGNAVELTGEGRSQLEETITEMASRGLRTLCLSYRDISAAQAAELGSFEEPPNSELVCCCICGIKVNLCRICHDLGTLVSSCLCRSDQASGSACCSELPVQHSCLAAWRLSAVCS